MMSDRSVFSTLAALEPGEARRGSGRRPAQVGEQETAHVLDDLGVDLLAAVDGQVLEHRLNASGAQNSELENASRRLMTGKTSTPLSSMNSTSAPSML
jgi:hypothetical protein